jgi:hypothetical protein
VDEQGVEGVPRSCGVLLSGVRWCTAVVVVNAPAVAGGCMVTSSGVAKWVVVTGLDGVAGWDVAGRCWVPAMGL